MSESDDRAARPVDEIRKAVVDRIQREIETWSAEGVQLEHIRSSFETLLAGTEQPLATPIALANTPTHLIGRAASDDRYVLFLHGGGFQIGSLRSHANLMNRISMASRIGVIGVEYRLAPEHRFPAAADDCLDAYRALIARGISADRILLAGDSAGGHLALGLALDAVRLGQRPAGLVLISPWLDLSLGGESYITRAPLDVFSKPAQLKAMARTYLGRNSKPDDPRIALLDADLRGLPPILVHAGDHDITLDDARRLAERAAVAGVPCSLKIWPGMMHHFQVFADLPEATRSIAEIGAFIQDILSRAGSRGAAPHAARNT